MKTKQTDKQNNTFSNHRNAFEKVILESNLSTHQKMIALILKSHMNNITGLCNPSIKTLMNKGSMSKGSVDNCIKALENAGFISKIAGNGRGNSTRYTLHIIESYVDNRNKHKGNTQNLEPNYSYEMGANPDDYPQEDFDDESQATHIHPANMLSEASSSETEYYPDHLDVLDHQSRERAEREINMFGYYFNENLRKHLYANGKRVAEGDVDF